jgi:hypothetical protein
VNPVSFPSLPQLVSITSLLSWPIFCNKGTQKTLFSILCCQLAAKAEGIGSLEGVGLKTIYNFDFFLSLNSYLFGLEPTTTTTRELLGHFEGTQEADFRYETLF